MARHGAPQLNTAQTDRAAGVLLAQACGDALGVPYEFAALPPHGQQPRMIGGGLGPYEPGEYSDDTQMAVCVAQVAATGADLTDDDALDEIAERFVGWLAGGATDVGTQTRAVLSRTGTGRPAAVLRGAARDLHAQTGRSAGNGALMRTAPVALAHLDEPAVMAEAAHAVAELTHADPLAGEACVLWCTGIATAVTQGTFDGVRGGLDLLAAPSRDRWAQWLADAEQCPPERFNPNGFTVPALQAAYSAIRRTPVPSDEPAVGGFGCLHLQHALAAAVRTGDDTDTVAAIAGSLLGARWGASAVPFGWRRIVHGWPGLRARDLVSLGVLAARAGEPDAQGWPQCARMPYDETPHPAVAHPFDPGVLLGGAGTVVDTSDVTAVVSLCRRGSVEAPASGVDAGDHVEVRLQDKTDPAENPNLEFVIDDAARAVAVLRDEGKRVLLHCVYGQSRTPTVAARYAVLRGVPVADALEKVVAAIPGARANPALRGALDRLGDPPA